MRVYIKGFHPEITNNETFTHFHTPQPGTAFESAKARFDDLVDEGWYITSVEIIFASNDQ